MTTVRRGLSICALSLLALATGSARAEPQTAQKELVEVVVSLSQKPLATTSWRAGRQLQTRTLANAQASLAAAHRDRGPGRADPLALPAGRQRDGRRRPALAARPTDVAPRSRDRLPERQLPPAARPQPAADRRAGALGPRPHERRPGDQDRDHRRGDRPDAPVLLAGRLHDAGGLPEGPDRVHDGEGDRRARLPAREPGAGSTPRSRSIPSCPRTARTSRASPPATRTRSPRASASPASRRARISATTRR